MRGAPLPTATCLRFCGRAGVGISRAACSGRDSAQDTRQRLNQGLLLQPRFLDKRAFTPSPELTVSAPAKLRGETENWASVLLLFKDKLSSMMPFIQGTVDFRTFDFRNTVIPCFKKDHDNFKMFVKVNYKELKTVQAGHLH